MAFSTLIYSEFIPLLTSVEGEIGIAGCSRVSRLYSQIFHSNQLTYNSIGISIEYFNSNPFWPNLYELVCWQGPHPWVWGLWQRDNLTLAQIFLGLLLIHCEKCNSLDSYVCVVMHWEQSKNSLALKKNKSWENEKIVFFLVSYFCVKTDWSNKAS